MNDETIDSDRQELLLGLLQVLLKTLDATVEGVHLGLGGHQGLLLLLQLQGDEGEALGGDVELGLELASLVHELEDLLLGLLGADLRHLAGLLAGIASKHQNAIKNEKLIKESGFSL